MELWVGALNLGFLYAFMTMGVFITFRIHDFPDITVDGSFTSGAAATAVMIAAGFNPLAALLAGLLIGMVAGAVTAWIHTRLNINGLLAGILVMTGLYSVNLHIMGRSNIPLLNQTTLFTWIQKTNPGQNLLACRGLDQLRPLRDSGGFLAGSIPFLQDRSWPCPCGPRETIR